MKKTELFNTAGDVLTYADDARFAILGNPNAGKTALFNRLTGLHHKIGNFPGVTVEKRAGYLRGKKIILEDYPGTYSLRAQSLDEEIVSHVVQSWRKPENRPDGVIVVVDATNLARNIYLALQILDWGLPTVIVLNMMDEARRRGIVPDHEILQRRLSAVAVIPASAKTGEGFDAITSAIDECLRTQADQNPEILLKIDDRFSPLQEIIDVLTPFRPSLYLSPLIDGLRLLADDSYQDHIEPYLPAKDMGGLRDLLRRTRQTFHARGISVSSLESAARYAYIDDELLTEKQSGGNSSLSLNERIDTLITHPVAGFFLFFLIMSFIFTAVFSWAEYPMGLIESGVSKLNEAAALYLPDNSLGSLIRDGIIGGVGNVIVFLPQIILLVFFLGLLEDSGYMARMSFLMDGLMRRIGLHGKAVLPLLSGFACAIPAIMAARTIESWRDRRLVIMLIPLMSCSARLPVYTLLISAFIPSMTIFGILELQGLVLLAVYFMGFLTAIIVSVIIRLISKQRKTQHFVMEMPPYRRPLIRSMWWRIHDAGKAFIINAGSIILAVTVVLWFLASYPKAPAAKGLSPGQQVEQSYAGKLGHALEPLIEPLGFDWKIGVGLVTSFAAREVIIATFATIYNIEADDENLRPLAEIMQEDRRPDGSRVFTTLTALSLLVFFVFAAQCMSTFAIIKRETNSWTWPLIMVVYMNALAYIAAFIVYRAGILAGLA